VRAAHPGLGLVMERQADDPAAALAGFGAREQTLSLFGVAPETVLAAIDAHGRRTVDRIVPVGRALAFAPIWDGHDLLGRFSRRIGLS
jgi:hypothetical protein